MPFQSAPECAEAVIQGTLSGRPVANVLNFWLPGGYTQADLDALAAAVDGEVGTLYLPEVTTAYAYTGTLVRGLQNIVDISSLDATSAGPGTEASGGGVPSNASLCITLRSGFTGRSARGRFYAIPASAGRLTSVIAWNATYGNAMNAFLAGVKSAALAQGWHHVILSRRTASAVRPAAVHFDVATAAYRNLLIDSQRRRLAANH